MSRILVIVPKMPWLKQRPKNSSGTYQWDGKKWVKVSEKAKGLKERPHFPKDAEGKGYYDWSLGKFIRDQQHLEQVMREMDAIELTDEEVRNIV